MLRFRLFSLTVVPSREGLLSRFEKSRKASLRSRQYLQVSHLESMDMLMEQALQILVFHIFSIRSITKYGISNAYEPSDHMASRILSNIYLKIYSTQNLHLFIYKYSSIHCAYPRSLPSTNQIAHNITLNLDHRVLCIERPFSW
jgi:hypothetical protein